MSLKTQAKVLRVLQEQVDRAGRRHRSDQGRRARARRDQQGPAGGDPRRPVPRGPLLPAERHPDLRAAAARPRRGHPAAGRALHGASSRASTAGGRRRSTPGAVAALQQLPLAGQRARAAQRDRAADDHGAGRHDHRSATWRSSTATARAGEPAEPTRPVAAAARGARAVRARLHPARRWPRSRATSRAPPRCSASSAATSTGR